MDHPDSCHGRGAVPETQARTHGGGRRDGAPLADPEHLLRHQLVQNVDVPGICRSGGGGLPRQEDRRKPVYLFCAGCADAAAVPYRLGLPGVIQGPVPGLALRLESAQ